MSRVDELAPDRRAVLQLLLKQGKSYEDLAGLLRIEPDAVRDRARDALDQLGPADGAGLDPDRQDEVADYLLGQQSASSRAATRAFLEDSAAGRAWARVVAGELRPLSDSLPEIPSERAETDEAFDALSARREARTRQQKSSKLGGVLILVATAIVAVGVILLITGGKDDDNDSAAVSATSTSTTGTTSTTPANVTILGQANLNQVSGGKGIAVVQLVRQGDAIVLGFQGEKIPRRADKTVFAMWLTKKDGTNPVRLGFIDQQTPKNGKLQFAGEIPSGVDPTQYDRMLLTRETTADPSKPGSTLMAGGFTKAP